MLQALQFQTLAAIAATQFNSIHTLCYYYAAGTTIPNSCYYCCYSVKFTLCATIMPMELQVQTLAAIATTQFN